EAVQGIWGNIVNVWTGGNYDGFQYDRQGKPLGFSPIMGLPPDFSLSKPVKILEMATNLRKVSKLAKEISVPKGWIKQDSKKGGGIVFKDPQNPHNIIRQMPGNANSTNLLQRTPYVKFMKEGKFYDVTGKPLKSGDLPEAHIPLDKFDISKMPKF